MRTIGSFLRKPGRVLYRAWIGSALRRGLRRTWAAARYRAALRAGEAAGVLSYHLDAELERRGDLVAVFRSESVSRLEGEAFYRGQSLRPLRVVGVAPDGSIDWSLPDEAGAPPDLQRLIAECTGFFAPVEMEDAATTFLESAALVLCAEQIDAVAILPIGEDSGDAPERASDVTQGSFRGCTVYTSSCFEYRAQDGDVVPSGDPLVKLVEPFATAERTASLFHASRRGSYLGRELGPELSVGLRRRIENQRPHQTTESRGDTRPLQLLVTMPFLAEGGAEHILLEVLRGLQDRAGITLVTLAPHRRDLGDRREAFLEVVQDQIYLGDLLHPDAMTGMLLRLIDSRGIDLVFNANGTTLFYDLFPEIVRERPYLRVVDQLWDHRVGYIEYYEDRTLAWIDTVLAANHRIRERLVEELGRAPQSVSVVWPPGRRDCELPPPADRPATRARWRERLGFDEGDFVVLVAARMHPQKRPLDVVELARRFVGEPVRFVMAGGGPLEGEVDAALVRDDVPAVRLPFVEDIPGLIVAADIGCLVSQFEGLPVFLAECLQLGRPFVSTDVGDVARVLETECGTIVERPGDIDALESAVRGYLDSSRYEQAAAAALARSQVFSTGVCAEHYFTAIRGSGS